MKKALFVLLAMLALGSPAFAQQRSANLTTQASTCGTPPVASTAYIFVPVNTANGGATITVSGTWSGTISFFASGDGADTWVALNATPSNSGTAASTTTGNGTWQANIAGYTHVCAAFTTASSGKAVVSLQLSQASARSGGGGGGGGGISGTVSSPFVPFASGPDALSDSAFGYEASGNASCPINPALYFLGMGNRVCIGPDQLLVSSDDSGLYFFLNDNELTISDAAFNAIVTLSAGTGNLALGSSMFSRGGSITLNGATSGVGASLVGDDGMGNTSGVFTSGASVLTFGVSPGAVTLNLTNSEDPDDGIDFLALMGEGGEVIFTDASGNVAQGGAYDGMPFYSVMDSMGGSASMQATGGIGTIILPNLGSMSGQRFLCIGTDGTVVSSATACVGT